MDNQNLNNGLNQNNSDTNLNNTISMNNNINPMNQTTNVETLEILDDVPITPQPQVNTTENGSPDFNSFIKQPEVVVQNPNDLLNAVPKPDMMISSPDVNNISSDELLEEYIGKNYEKISKRKFNLSAFFLTSAYLFYRKMILLGLLVSILTVVIAFVGILINPIIIFVLSLALALVLCFMFNKLYIDNAKKNIDKIRKKNTNKSISELKAICRKNGGGSVAYAIVFSLIAGAITSAIITITAPILAPNLINEITGMFNRNNISSNNNEGNSTNENIDEDTDKYNGQLNYNTSININDNVNIGFLQVFKPSTFNSDYTIDYDYLTIPDDQNSKCNFKLSVINKYASSKTLIDEMAKYNSVSEVTSTTSSKNITWDIFTLTGDLKTTYYTATTNNDLVYLLEYNIDSNANVNICDAFYNGIVNSIDFK